MKQQNRVADFLKRAAMSLLIPVGIWAVFVVAVAIKNGDFNGALIYKQLITTLRQMVQPALICYGLMLNMLLGMMNFSAGGMMLFAGIIGGTAKTSLRGQG